MKSYGQYCPLAKAAELIGDRWSLLIVRELMNGATRFNEIERGLPRISRSLLSQRLRWLASAGLVERRDTSGQRGTGYRLSGAGEALGPVVMGLGEWGAAWAFGDPDPAELDPLLLLWWIRGGVDHDALPDRRVVVQFDFSGANRSRYWLVLEPSDASVCLADPGFDSDLILHADLATLYKVYAGRMTLGEAEEAGLVRISGLPSLARAVPRWLPLSPLAGAVRARVTPS